MGRAENRAMLLDTLPKGGKGAEVGVWKGGFSEEILRICTPTELHLIDPWELLGEFASMPYGSGRNDMDAIYQEVADKFADRAEVTLHRTTSEAALATFPDHHFDWVYLDGNHHYEFVAKDLEMARAKVKPGGVIAGDDFFWKKELGWPVRTAVFEFRKRLGEDKVGFERIGQQYRMTLPT